MNTTENKIDQKDKATDYSFFFLLGIMGLGAILMLGYFLIQALS